MTKQMFALSIAAIAISIPAAAGIQRTVLAPSRSASTPMSTLHSIAAPASALPLNAPAPPVAVPPLPLAAWPMLPMTAPSTPNVAPLVIDRASPWEDANAPLATDRTSPIELVAPIPKSIETVDQWTGTPFNHVVAKKMQIDRSDPWNDPPAPTEMSF